MNKTKDSGVYWLGGVASDWDLVPAWKVMGERKERSEPEDDHLTPSQTYGVVTQQEYMEITGNRVVLNLTGADNMKRVCSGDFIIHLRSFQGGIEASTVGGKVSNAYTVLTPQAGAHFDYYRWFMKSAPLIEGLASSTDQLRDGQSINYSRFSRLTLPLPPLETQQRIADYLDRETAEIDATVADLDKYVELLEKRKKAVGSSLLDDAIEDMSTLMVHLGSVGTFISGSGFPHDYQGIEDEEYPFYKVGSLSTTDGNAIVRDFRNTVSKETALELGAKVIPGGSVLMAKIGEAMRLCRFAVNATNCCVDNNMMAIVPRFEHITTDYLRLALTLVTVDVLVNPGPVPSLNVQGLRMFSIPLPSLEIQERLTAEWKKETSEIDDLIAESTKLRDLLLKRRSVLITDVVTGRKQV